MTNKKKEAVIFNEMTGFTTEHDSIVVSMIGLKLF